MDTTSWITLGTGLIAGLGLGSVFTSLVQHSLKLKESTLQSQRKDLEGRYKVIILLMYAAFDFESNKTTMRIHRADLKDRQDVLDELKAEWYNMLLFASGETQQALHKFITNPSIDMLKLTAMCMRKDLAAC